MTRCCLLERAVWPDRPVTSIRDASLFRLGAGANGADEQRAEAARGGCPGSDARPRAPTPAAAPPRTTASSTAGRGRSVGRPQPADCTGRRRTAGDPEGSPPPTAGRLDDPTTRGDTADRHRARRGGRLEEGPSAAGKTYSSGLPVFPAAVIPARSRQANHRGQPNGQGADCDSRGVPASRGARQAGCY